MLTFKYEARNATTGQLVKSTVQADNEQTAARLIQEQGLSVVSMKAQEEKTIGFFNRVKTKDRILFARQLSTLINAGLPLMQSLRLVQKQTTSKPLKVIVGEIIVDIEGGKSFSAALSRYPQVFGPVFINLVAAGEASGTLDAALQRLADQQEKDADIVAKVRGAMVYPAVVLLVMIAVVGFMIVKVLPQVKVLYEGIPGASLPFVTVALLFVSDMVIKFWWVLLIIIVLAAIFGTRWARTAGGKRFIDRVKMRAPIFGPLFMKVYMARFCRTGSTLIASGVPLIQMLEITGNSINNVYIQDSVNAAIVKVKAGKSLSDALENDPNFLELVPNMIRIGEQSGSLEEMLAKTADYYEKEVDNTIKNISTIIEPVLMVILGVVALIIVAAVLLPVYGLAGKDLG